MNIANGDMVGHTGDPKATVIGCETVDKAVKVQCTIIHACWIALAFHLYLILSTLHFSNS